MQRIVLAGSSYLPIRLRESEYEQVVMNNFASAFPGWRMFLWKPLIGGVVRPDAIIVREDYSEYAVVEVELAIHGIGHFDPQFERLAAASYGIEILESIRLADVAGDLRRWEELIRRSRPMLVCVADDATDALRRACEEHLFELVTLQAFRGEAGDFLISVNQAPRWLKVPSSRVDISFQMERTGRVYGSRELVYLPPNFPKESTISIRTQNVVGDVAVKHMKDGKRFIALPGNVAIGAAGGLRLRVVDASIRLFELEEFEVAE